ncbi:MAG: ATP-dependent protease [Planctomyces sp.]|nr:ATP-dependent protease [Planctomyces sp.]MBA4120320.1 ATP-dependent protease [Isosphaera sp.]
MRVNFGRPMPVFPLGQVSLMPHAVLPLHIFEPRYRDMVRDVLDGPGQIAMAVFDGQLWRQEYDGRPPLRPAVCVGQIVRHQKLPDGRYLIELHGVCRARIVGEIPEDEDVAYRLAMLEPVGIGDPSERQEHEQRLLAFRRKLEHQLRQTGLKRLSGAEGVLEHLGDEEVPTVAILELLTFSVIQDAELRYRLLAEADPVRRAALLETELGGIRRLVDRAEGQLGLDAPKGVSWN